MLGSKLKKEKRGVKISKSRAFSRSCKSRKQAFFLRTSPRTVYNHETDQQRSNMRRKAIHERRGRKLMTDGSAARLGSWKMENAKKRHLDPERHWCAALTCETE